MIDLAFDYGPWLGLAALIITVCYFVKDVGLVEWRSIVTPPERTVRPEPVEDIDWLGEWRPVGGPPAWKDVRFHD